MTLPTKTLPTFVDDMVATWASEVGLVPTFTSGDALLAFWQSVAAQLSFLQAQIKLVVALSRANTSSGADLDSWMAQFNFTRLPATNATTNETFTKLTPAAGQIIVPLGAIVQTVGGAIQFQVVADSTQPTYSASAGGYVLSVGSTSLTATIQALTPGASGNVGANTLSQIGSALPGIDQVTNPAPVTNGVDAESDTAFRARFILYLATLAKGTQAALQAAAEGVQQGLLISLEENTTPSGVSLLGSFTVIADDGTGNPPTALLNSIYDAVYATRAFSVQPFVAPPTILSVAIAITIRITSTVQQSAISAAVQSAIAIAVNALAAGEICYVSAINAAALSVSGVVSVSPGTTTLNGQQADIQPTIAQEVRTTVGAITISYY